MMKVSNMAAGKQRGRRTIDKVRAVGKSATTIMNPLYRMMVGGHDAFSYL
jgi:hypothetical protein